jgi:hypothetical protein
MTTPSLWTTCQTLLAKCRLRGRPSRLGSSQATAITSANTQSANCGRGPGRGASRSENRCSTQRRRHLQTHEVLCPNCRAASGLGRSGCSWRRSASLARCTSACGSAWEQAQARASATLASEKRGWYLGGGPPCQGRRARGAGWCIVGKGAPPSVGSGARRTFQRTRRFSGYLSLPDTWLVATHDPLRFTAVDH